MKYTVYTDGSTKNNGKENCVGGWAYIILDHDQNIIDQASAAEKPTTNQRMELSAAIRALQVISFDDFTEVELFTDSAYLCNCVNNQWYVNWLKNGWVNSKKQPVANRDLWEQLIPFFDHPMVSFKKVKGHNGDYWNEQVDTLAQNAAKGGLE